MGRVNPEETHKVVDRIREKLEDGVPPPDTPRRVYVDAVKGTDTTGVYQARTWECPTHKQVLLEGNACPDCGRQQLLD